MSLVDFCSTPKTMAKCREEGFTKDMVYNAVKHGKLVNVTRHDAWGRIAHNKIGMFVNPDAPLAYNTQPLLSVWNQNVSHQNPSA